MATMTASSQSTASFSIQSIGSLSKLSTGAVSMHSTGAVSIQSTGAVSMQSAGSKQSTASIYRQLECVERLKAENVDKFTQLVTSNLSVLLDLNGEALSEIIEDDECLDESRTASVLLTPFLRRKKPKVCGHLFGCVLSQQHIDRMLPLITFLSKPENLCQEGVFRKNGNVERQRSLRERLDRQEKIDWLEDAPRVHDCTAVLKSFLRDLSEPLLTSRHYNAYTQVAAMKDEVKQLSSLQLLVQLLPAENFSLLQHLLTLLHGVTKHPNSLMDARNLAIVFTMHVIVPRKMDREEQKVATERLTSVIELMIRRADVVFHHPPVLVADVTRYLTQAASAPGSAASLRRVSAGCAPGSAARPGSGATRQPGRRASVASARSHKKRDESYDDDDIVISSTVVFADREASTAAAATSNTTTALAALHAHIAGLPDSTRKRKLIGLMNKSSGTENCDTVTHSVSKSLRQFFSGRKRHRDRMQKILHTASTCGGGSTPGGERRKSPLAAPHAPHTPALSHYTPVGARRAPVARLFTDQEQLRHIAEEAPSHEADKLPAELRLHGDAMSGVRRLAVEEDYDSDDLQCSLGAGDTDVDDDDVSITDYDYDDDSDKENESSSVKNNGDVMTEIGVLLKSTVATPIRREGGKYSAEGDEEGEDDTPVAVRLRGYISPLVYVPV